MSAFLGSALIPIWTCLVPAILLNAVGCKHRREARKEGGKSTEICLEPPYSETWFNAQWLADAEVVHYGTSAIYYHGIADGDHVGHGPDRYWVGEITGQVAVEISPREFTFCDRFKGLEDGKGFSTRGPVDIKMLEQPSSPRHLDAVGSR